MAPVIYPLSVDSWRSVSPSEIIIRSSSRKVIASFPLAFLRRGGDDTWNYIFRILEQVVECKEGEHWTITREEYHEDSVVDLGQPPIAGSYIFRDSGELGQAGNFSMIYRLAPLTVVDIKKDMLFTRGPEYFRKSQAPNPEGSVSTRSDSKRSTTNQVRTDNFYRSKTQMTDVKSQSRFRSALLSRDGVCLVTEVDYEFCTACHIVPFSRPDVSSDLLFCAYLLD